MSKVTTIENAAMERQEAMDTRPQDQYARRGKFNFCHRCGSLDGMQHVHKDTLADMTDHEIEILASWYRLDYEPFYLYYPCPRCNVPITISDGFVPVPTGEVLEWRSADPMVPDYDARAAETEPVLASQDSRDAAGAWTMAIKMKPGDPACWMLFDGITTTPVVYSANCYICNDSVYAQMGLPLCRKCPVCGGHIPADDSICDNCGFDEYEAWCIEQEALAAEEPVSQITDARGSAGLEG